MAARYAIGPTIGVARLGNSPDSFYLAPVQIGGLPIECDSRGNKSMDGNVPRTVKLFKDPQGRIRRQAALFTIFQFEDNKPGVEVGLNDPNISSITWTAHIANKKACWYNFSELQGNLLYGEKNSYKACKVPLRNAGKTSTADRRKLIIDPGPRTLSGASQRAEFSKETIPAGYKFGSFPGKVIYGDQITTLGSMITDDAGRLLVLGGFGRAGGDESITSFAGADTWHDDISDGPVHCTLKLKTGDMIELNAWCIVGSPKFAPEIANIVTLDDTMYDVAVRHFNCAPDLCKDGKFNSNYVAAFETDIKPILDRPGPYRWVANVPSMNSMSPPPFNARDNSSATAGARKAYVSLFRRPGPEDSIGPDSNTLFSQDGFPLVPLNSGSNSVSDALIDKFLALTETQCFLLKQWSEGKFKVDVPPEADIVMALTRASVGNCVGGPFCPGIEVTWSTRNPNIYERPLEIRPRHDNEYYLKHGLDPEEDETADKKGCEPGDLTKRMAIPWQADFFQCSIQFINFTNPQKNKDDSGIPLPPTYYAYWWPPQSPWQVITGDLEPQTQASAGTPAGFQVLYSRGINTFSQMISNWHDMAFIVNQIRAPYGEMFPYFTEQERNHNAFIAAAVAVGDATNVVSGADTNFSNTWFLPAKQPSQAHTLASDASGEGKPVSQAIAFSTSRRHGRRPSHN
jgi:L-Lysine epsilon oxidase N-terminal/L-lysine epsilon oxidase C-terminal domain